MTHAWVEKRLKFNTKGFRGSVCPFGVGGNIAVSIGDDGVLIVDDQFPQVMDKVQAAISKAGGGAVDYAVNTHWHFDC